MNRLALLVVVLVTLASRALGAAQEVQSVSGERTALVVWNRHIADFRTTYDNWDPAERVRRAEARILAAPAEKGTWVVAHQEMRAGTHVGLNFTLNGEFMFRLFDSDLDTESGETLEHVAATSEAALRDVMESRAQQRKWPVILRGAGISVVLTLLLVATLIGARRLRLRILDRFSPIVAGARARSVVGSINLWPIMAGLRQMIARILALFVAGGLTFLWLALVLEQFPYTEPWGDALGGLVLEVLSKIGWGVLQSIPGLFVVAVIIALANAFARGVGSYFLAVERDEVSIPWLSGETARATRLLLTILIWAFALVIAYPHIPGSASDAFKGVTVFLGLMVSLGSAGLVNQIMSGLTVIYSNAYHHGDYIKIGEHEGRVQQVGLLATKIAKFGGEVVSLPNAVVTSNTTTNFSPGARGTGEILATSITIGYDAPWRQVHALLLLAAKQTPELAKDPAPFVLQRALSDFFVEYQLVAHATRRDQRVAALSRLHGEIQDAFNQHGVQIMSPHFMVQPAGPVTVPRANWYAKPVAADEPAT